MLGQRCSLRNFSLPVLLWVRRERWLAGLAAWQLLPHPPGERGSRTLDSLPPAAPGRRWAAHKTAQPQREECAKTFFRAGNQRCYLSSVAKKSLFRLQGHSTDFFSTQGNGQVPPGLRFEQCQGRYLHCRKCIFVSKIMIFFNLTTLTSGRDTISLADSPLP